MENCPPGNMIILLKRGSATRFEHIKRTKKCITRAKHCHLIIFIFDFIWYLQTFIPGNSNNIQSVCCGRTLHLKPTVKPVDILLVQHCLGEMCLWVKLHTWKMNTIWNDEEDCNWCSMKTMNFGNWTSHSIATQMTKLMGPTWGPAGADMFAPRTLLSGHCWGYHPFVLTYSQVFVAHLKVGHP